jgi:serine/threonine protein kinase/tetratricopeptide (TPR) repeat protein
MTGDPSTTVLPDNDSPDLAEASVRDFAASRSLKRDILAELQTGWDEGQPPRPEDLLARWPGNPEDDPDVASLLFEDYCQRRRNGDEATPEEYDYRFPSLKGSLTNLCNKQDLLRSLGGGHLSAGFMLSLPAVNDEIFGFQLRRELGRGSFARVFLAEQAELAGRPVVVKVSAIDGDEPQTLAQLQHTHIVPIYSVHEDPRAGLRAVCMPYFGGASLSRVLHLLWSSKEPPREGAQLVQALGEVSQQNSTEPENPADNGRQSGAQPRRPTEDNKPLSVLERLDYVRATAWLIARLAEALQHAHERGVLHRDLKPSNILVGSDGQPMLLDFNLAQTHGAAGTQATATLGGTVAYMAPEHLRALAGRDPVLTRQVDHRADIYGLGMVLYEMLTGRRPFDQSASYSPIPALIEAMAVERAKNTPSLRGDRPDVPWSLESISRKCLASDPGQRYQQAQQLATDLRCFLEDRPLRYAPELSGRERCAKWVRRHPRLAATGSVVAVAAVILAIGGAVLMATREQLRAARARTYEAEGAEARERYRLFSTAAERARCLANTKTDCGDNTEEGLVACKKALAYYDVASREDWQRHPAFERLDSDEQHSVSEDVRELLILTARARVRQAASALHRASSAPVSILSSTSFPAPLTLLASWVAVERVGPTLTESLKHAKASAVEQSLALLERADAIPGLKPSRALWLDRAAYLAELGDHAAAEVAAQRAESTALSTAHDHYMLATLYAYKRDFSSAVAELKQALRLNSRHYWSHFMLATCHYELRDFTQAVASSDVCIALWPEAAWAYLNHGRALQQLGKTSEALDDYSAVLAADPSVTAAYINRGTVYLNLNKPAEALADLDVAIKRGTEHASVEGLRGIALEQLGRFAEADKAFALALERDPDNVEIQLAYGFAVSRRLPNKSKEAFTSVLKQEPRNARALYGYGMVLAEQARASQAAVACFTLALDADPTLVAARRGRANVLAHQGDWEKARDDIDWCVKADPSRETLYAAGCVYGVMVEKCPEQMNELLTNRALVLLEEALKRGYGRGKLKTDPDLAALRHHREFRRLYGSDTSPKR